MPSTGKNSSKPRSKPGSKTSNKARRSNGNNSRTPLLATPSNNRTNTRKMRVQPMLFAALGHSQPTYYNDFKLMDALPGAFTSAGRNAPDFRNLFTRYTNRGQFYNKVLESYTGETKQQQQIPRSDPYMYAVWLRATPNNVQRMGALRGYRYHDGRWLMPRRGKVGNGGNSGNIRI